MFIETWLTQGFLSTWFRKWLGIEMLDQRSLQSIKLNALLRDQVSELQTKLERQRLEIEELQAIKRLVELPSADEVELELERIESNATRRGKTNAELTFAVLSDELRAEGFFDAEITGCESPKYPRVFEDDFSCCCAAPSKIYRDRPGGKQNVPFCLRCRKEV